jgi:hypothetical protein
MSFSKRTPLMNPHARSRLRNNLTALMLSWSHFTTSTESCQGAGTGQCRARLGVLSLSRLAPDIRNPHAMRDGKARRQRGKTTAKVVEIGRQLSGPDTVQSDGQNAAAALRHTLCKRRLLDCDNTSPTHRQSSRRLPPASGPVDMSCRLCPADPCPTAPTLERWAKSGGMAIFHNPVAFFSWDSHLLFFESARPSPSLRDIP